MIKLIVTYVITYPLLTASNYLMDDSECRFELSRYILPNIEG